MKKILFTALFLTGYSFYSKANVEPDSTTIEPDSASYSAQMAALDSLVQAFDYKTGQVKINNDLATITVPVGFSFLEGKDAQFVLTKIWGNPEDKDVLGMLVPKNVNLLEGGSWVVIYSYEEEGHVKDDDAEDIKYDELLEQMQKEMIANNPERVKQGYSTMELVGWAKTPFYDKSTHKLHWAKELKFSGDSLNTLNYNIRMLGRKGVLVMNVVSGMDNMKIVEDNMNAILASTNFNSGNGYENFDEKVDKVAEYGIGGLIAGGILLKTGILAKLGILLVKVWKLLAIGVVSLVAFFKKKFSRKKKAADESDQNKIA